MWKLKNKLVTYGKKPLEINNKLTVTAFGILWYILRFNRLIPILMNKDIRVSQIESMTHCFAHFPGCLDGS
jgi:hypothetical protein